MIAYEIGRAVLAMGCLALSIWLTMAVSKHIESTYNDRGHPWWAMPAAAATFVGSMAVSAFLVGWFAL